MDGPRCLTARMPKPAGPSNPFVSRISLVGRSTGLVKNLAGFRKQHHTVPDAVNAATTAFLGKLCAAELARRRKVSSSGARPRSPTSAPTSTWM